MKYDPTIRNKIGLHDGKRAEGEGEGEQKAV